MRNAADKLARAKRAFITDLFSNASRGAAGRRPKFARPWAGARGQILSFGLDYPDLWPAERAPCPGAWRTAWQAAAFAAAEGIEGKLILRASKKMKNF